MTPAASGRVLAERRGPVLLVSMNRPERLNALAKPDSREMRSIFEDFRAADDLLVAVVTGVGDRAFSAGNDLLATAEKFDSGPVADAGPPVAFGGITRDFSCPKPIVAAVNGLALGGGFELALACDIVVAAEHASFGLPEVRRGFVAGLGGVQRLPRQTSLKWAMGLLLTGEPISALTAFQAGLVNEVVPAGEAVSRALDWAGRIAACSPSSVRLTKQLVHESLELTEDEAMSRSAGWLASLRQYEDFYEGPRAFRDRRPPRWTGALVDPAPDLPPVHAVDSALTECLGYLRSNQLVGRS